MMKRIHWLGGAMAVAASLAATPSLAETPAEGDPAPEFRLQDQNGDWHSPSDFRGQWLVLYFYPKDDTPGCTTEACNFRDSYHRFRELNAAVVGVSLDDVESHGEFASKYELPFPLLADTEKEAARKYDVLTNMAVLEFASRETFLIDPEGRIARHYEDVDPDTHHKTVLSDLRELMGLDEEPEKTAAFQSRFVNSTVSTRSADGSVQARR